MALTPLTALADLIVDALIALGGTATPKQVIERIGDGDFQPTDDDQVNDPDANRPVWQSRVYIARSHLGDDDLVLTNRGRWVLTAAGRDSADRRREAATMSAPQLVAQPLLIQPSVIAAPVRNPRERAKVTRAATGDDEPMSVLIELNLAYPGGIAWAYTALTDMFVASNVIPTAAEMPALFEEYVPASLSPRMIEALVRADAPEPKTHQRIIYRVWPDFPVYAQIDVSCRTVKADASRRAFDACGEGITWAVIDSGIDASHPHFSTGDTLRAPDVADLHRDFTTSLDPFVNTVDSALQDTHGDGTGHGTGVASIIAGYLPEQYPAANLEVMTEQLGTNGQVVRQQRVVAAANLAGMAPKAHLVSLKVLSDASSALTVMAALRYVMQVNGDADKRPRIHGVNLSVGYEFDPQWFACGQSPLCQAVDRLVRSGVVVVVAAGNTGYARFSVGSGGRGGGLTMSINDPGNAERAITVGATHRSAPYTYGVSFFSSKGPTGDGRLKPDLVAPGERITVATAGAGDPAQRRATYADTSGTSFAAPHVSGVIAAFLSVRPEFVSQPERIKQILIQSASPLGRERQFEGGGLVDLMRALQSV